MRTAHPDTGVIVLSQYADPSYATGLLDGGTAGRGYLLKERISHFEQLSEAVHQVAGGGTVLDPLVVEALLAQPNSVATLSRLTLESVRCWPNLRPGSATARWRNGWC